MAFAGATGGTFSGFGAVLRGTRLAVAGLLLTALAGGLTGCVSADEHKRLQTAFDQARQQLAEAENDLRNAQTKITELEGKIADLNRLLDTSSGGLGAITRQRDLLQQQLAELRQRYDELSKMSGAPALPVDVNSQLRELVAQYPDLLEFDERLGMVRLKSDLTFDVGSTEVKPQAKAALARLAQVLNTASIATHEVQVVGHTDDIPIRSGGPTAVRNPDNWTLSTNRAWAVLGVLRANGVNENRGMGSGWGDQRPIAPNAPGKRGNEKNRRVDIYIRPTTVPEGTVVSTPGAAGAPAAAPRRAPAAGRPAATRPATRPAATAPGMMIPM